MGEEFVREVFKPVDPEGLIAETASGSASELVAVLDRSRFSVGKATLSVVYNCLSAARSRDRGESVDSHFWDPNWEFRSAGNTRLSNALADLVTNEAAAKLSK
jgi:hypothetical protein